MFRLEDLNKNNRHVKKSEVKIILGEGRNGKWKMSEKQKKSEREWREKTVKKRGDINVKRFLEIIYMWL